MEKIKTLDKLNVGRVIYHVPLNEYTTYRVGGIGRALVIVDNQECLIKLVHFLEEKNIRWKILGNGSNLIFQDGFYDGVLISLSNLNQMEIDGTEIMVEAGYPLPKLAMKAAKASLTGLEFAAGIPGTVGGALFMNAGAYKSDMGYIVKQVTVITPDLKIKELSNSEMEFHYRTSYLKKNSGYIVLKAVIELKKGNKNEIMDIISDRKKRRLESQPLEYPSAGSVFRNPTNLFAGKLIEDIGYKGHQIGDACVSLKHANFIINKGHATGKDIISLIDEIKDKVEEKYGIELVLEQEIVK